MNTSTRYQLTICVSIMMSVVTVLAICAKMEIVATAAIAAQMTILSTYIWSRTVSK